MWREIARYSDPISAEIARGYLEAHGVEARLEQESAARMIGLYMGPFGQIALLVREDQVEQALDLLERMEQGQAEEPPPPLTDMPNGDHPPEEA